MTDEIEEALNVLARFIGRAVNVPGDLDALEALTTVKSHVAQLERHDQAATQDAILFRGRMVDAEARVQEQYELLCEAIRRGERLEAALREIATTVTRDDTQGILARRALEPTKEEA